jgi:Fe2+ transport system protein FeoA
MTTPATKIVIVAGSRFSVPAETDNEAVRQQLLAMGFADVASATIKTGDEGGQATVEFVKKAGTKG